jgi:hypothetical protein
MDKLKRNQIELPLVSQGRDKFQTPNYATELLVPFIPKYIHNIWEPACGEYKITNVLREHGYNIISTDIMYGENYNFFSLYTTFKSDAIITNPPFSLKRRFYDHANKWGIPFALLIPADYSGWVIDAIKNGAEKIIPTRRIDYITPSGKSGKSGHSSNFHSMWLTVGFALGKTETFVELTNKMKENI